MVIGAAALAVVELVRGLRRDPGVEVRVGSRHLLVRMRGWDVLWAQRLWTRIPLSDVLSAAVDRGDDLTGRGLPLWGTAIPGVLRAGTVLVDGHRELWNARPDALLLRVELRGARGLRRMMLQVADPRTVADSIRVALA